MTVERETETEIRRLFFAEHWKKGTIAEQLRLHHDVVDRVLGPHGPEPTAAAAPRARAIDVYRSFIIETLERYPGLVSTRIYDMLGERGYTGSARSVRRFVGAHRPPVQREVYLRLDTLPGEQSQIDWAHVGKLRVSGGERPLYCFVLLLRHSRAMWAELVLEQTTTSLVRSLVRAANFFGGVTHQWLFDNPKSIVAAREGNAIRFQSDLVELAGSLHVSLRACRVRKPTDKGGVERGIRFLKTRFFPARLITSVESGNQSLWNFLERVALQRKHPTQRTRTVAEVFAEERERLLPVPTGCAPPDTIIGAVADSTAFVALDSNRYSVPPDAANRQITIAANDTAVRFFDGPRLVATHPRSWAKNAVVEDAEHRAAILQLKPGGRDGKSRDRLRAVVPNIGPLLQRWLEAGVNLGSFSARAAKLVDLYGPEVVTAAVDDLLKKDSYDYGALAMLCEQRRTRPRPLLPLTLGPHVVDRDVIPHDLGGYDDEGR
jgi:transposase